MNLRTMPIIPKEKRGKLPPRLQERERFLEELKEMEIAKENRLRAKKTIT